MRRPSIHRQKWILAALSLLLCLIRHSEAAEETWSKPESTVSSQDNNGWIPVQGKCLTCRPNRDLDAQTTNEQINKVLSPPAPLSPSPNPPYGSAAPPFGSAGPQFGSAAPPFGSAAPPPHQLSSLPPQPQQQQHQQHQQIPQQQHHQIQSTPYKQPRILPFGGPNFHQLNLPFSHEHKFPLQPTKLFPQEGQKQFYQFEGNHFQKQPFNLPQQQLIQTPPQQRFPIQEPYPFTLPLKTIEATTPKINYNPKIRFPDNDGPSKPINKPPPQNVDEIQLLYVPVETLNRQRHVKNMKELINQQNQQYQQIPQSFVPPGAFNVQYQPAPFPKPENNLFFPPNYAPPSNFLQLNPQPAQRLPDNVFQNISKSLLQPYFTINGLYSPLPPPQIAPIPTKQSDLQYFLQPTLINSPPVLKPEPSALPPPPPPPPPQQINRQPNKYDFNNVQVQNLQGGFILSNGNSINDIKPQAVSQTFESYPVTTPEILRTSTEYITEKPTISSDFNYNYITGSPQTSASQNQYVSQQTAQSQQYYNQQNLIPRNVTKSAFTAPPPAQVPASAAYDENEYPVPHQPPLSFYMEKLHNTKINDVLFLLKDSKTIPVLDTVESEPPQVFVGPSELQPPKGYVKFELPYLSSLDYNRIERMIDRLPFFVAPLNFKPPPGYSKIPFPAPHIGSVVLSNSTVLQESLNRYDQKYKSPQSYSPTPELSTITPQLTSQINSLIDAPIPSVASEIIKSFEDSTKKTIYKNTYRPASSSEAPKRNLSRQRKPIFRGYPTTETPTTYETSSTTTEAPKIVQNNNEYVEFAAKGKFNFAADPSQNPTYQPTNQVVDSYQSPPAPENTYQPQTADTYQSPQVASTYQPTQQSQYDTNFTTYASYQNNAVDQTQNENLFTKKIASQVEYNGNQNYPFYNFDLSSSQAPSDTPAPQNTTQEAQNFNFNNVKPLSQYNHFLKKEDVSPVNITEPAISSTSDASYQFWNQNQFYKNNPNTLDYFSSTVSNHIAEPTPPTTTTTEEPTTASRFLKHTTETSIRTEQTYTSELQKQEPQSTVESTSTTTTHRPRNKQRIPNRYQSKYTTEKHEEESEPSPKPTYDKAAPQELDSVQQSTENNEASTRVEIKRRRRPTRPAQIVTAVTEPSSSTSRSFRTRATRYPTAAASSTERYRPRRPTTNAITEEYTSNYAPSAPASNEIIHEKKADLEKDRKPEDNYWSEAVSIHQSQSYEVTPSKSSKNFTEEGPTDYLPWTDAAPKNSASDGSFYTTIDSRVPERAENRTQDPTVESSLNEKPTGDQVSPTFGTVNYSSTDEHVQQEEKQDQEAKKDKFLTKDDGQKKAYDPQDEKKVPGRRRGTWVRRIRIKRPQDVFETAESQNLGHISDNSVQQPDSKVLSKTDESKGSIDESALNIKIKPTSAAPEETYITTTEPSSDIITMKPTTTEKDDYQSLQNNFAQMLSDFLNSNDQSVKSVNIERNTSSAENNIGHVLGLDSNNQNTVSNSSSSYISPVNAVAVDPTEITDEATTVTYPNSGEYSDFQTTTTEDNLETFLPNRLIGTSTTTEISLETEICYRGKCVKTKKSKASDLLPVE